MCIGFRTDLWDTKKQSEIWMEDVMQNNIQKMRTKANMEIGIRVLGIQKEYKSNTNKFKFLTMVSAMKILVTLWYLMTCFPCCLILV